VSTANSAFEKQDLMAEDILTHYRGRIVAVRKATRAGATFSLLKRAFELGQKTVIVAPYRKIFDETVNDFVLLAQLFRHSEELSSKWVDLERDLPLLVRILRLCDKKGKNLPVSEILSKDKERANQFVTTYGDVLARFGINVIKDGSGSRLESTVDLKQYFPLYSI
jgi:hypothetical protein